MRILQRHKDFHSGKPSLDWIERAFKSTRESREYLLKSLREKDKYHFKYVYSNGVVDQEVESKSVKSDSKEVNLEIENTRKMVIIEEHVKVFGDYISKFLGLTIQQAFEKIHVN